MIEIDYGEVVKTHCLEIFKSHLGNALGNLLWASLFEQLSWIRWPLEDPTNLSYSVILWFSFPGSFLDWVSVCWEHQLCSDPLENTVCDPFCYIPLFNLIQNCDVPRLCTQINKQLNILMGLSLPFFILLKSIICTYTLKNIFLCFMPLVYLFRSQILSFSSASLLDFIFSTSATFRYHAEPWET